MRVIQPLNACVSKNTMFIVAVVTVISAVASVSILNFSIVFAVSV